MVQIIVVIASVLLGMILYPILLNKYRRFISGEHRRLNKEQAPIEEKKVLKTEEIPSIIRKKKYNLRQSTPNTATDLKNDNSIEKDSTFAPETGEESPLMDMDHPLEKEKSEEKIDMNDEEEKIGGAGSEGVQASGLDFDELGKIKQVVENTDVSYQQEREAGKSLSENRNTSLVIQMQEASPKLSERISNLIDLHLNELTQARIEDSSSENNDKQIESQDFKDFDVNSIF